MSDALSKKLDEIEDLAHADIENEWDDRLARGALALVAAVRLLPTAVKFYREEMEYIGGCDHAVGICCCSDIADADAIDEALHAIEELKL